MISGVRASSIRIESTVHDRVAVTALDDAVERDGHVVAQVVEAELGVRAVGDVRVVGLFALGERHHVFDRGGPHAELLVDRAHPARVALGEVVVDRDQVDAVARERVQVQRLRRHKRLSFAGLHLGDVTLVEDDPAHDLDVEGTLAERALSGLANSGIGLEEQLFERLAVLVALLELDGLGGELLVRELLELRLEAADVLRLVLQALEPPAFAESEDFFEAAEILGHRLQG